MCWGTEVVEEADRTKNIEATRVVVAEIASRHTSGEGKGKLSYILATPTP